MPTYDAYGRPIAKKQVRFAPGTVSPPPRPRRPKTGKMKEATMQDTQPHIEPSSRDSRPAYSVRPQYLFPQHDPPPSPPPSPSPRYSKRQAPVEHNIAQPRAPPYPTWNPHPAFVPQYHYPNQRPIYYYYPAYDPMMTSVPPPPPPPPQEPHRRQRSRAGLLAEAAASFACAAALISAVQDPRIPPSAHDTLRFAGQQLRYAATACC